MAQLELFEEEAKGLRAILTVAQVVVSSLELDEVLQNILCSAMGIMDMPAGSIALYEEASRELTLHAHEGLSPVFVARDSWRVKEGGLTHRILEAGELFVIEDTSEAEFFNNPLAHDEGIRCLIAAPLQIQKKIVGILYLNDFVPRRFSKGRLQLLSILGSFATMSIDNARLHQRTVHMACTDGLTGLYNHRQFKKMLKEEISRTKRYGKPLALIMLDVDDFKKFNDTYGHPAGDKVLTIVAGILRDLSRESDLAFRYGGEEFVVILPETTIDEALVAAERIRRVIESDSVPDLHGAVKSGVTVSAGVASCPRDGDSAENLLKTVDELLFQAKEQGKNKIHHLPS
jgi:diguanylate cyclase (GGDEF)-like protein